MQGKVPPVYVDDVCDGLRQQMHTISQIHASTTTAAIGATVALQMSQSNLVLTWTWATIVVRAKSK